MSIEQCRSFADGVAGARPARGAPGHPRLGGGGLARRGETAAVWTAPQSCPRGWTYLAVALAWFDFGPSPAAFTAVTW
jgi:hypothetical protein